MLTIEWPDGHRLPIRVLDPIEEGVTCRAPKSEHSYMTEQPARVLCLFLCMNAFKGHQGNSTREYHEIILTDAILTEAPELVEQSMRGVADGYHLTTQNPEFHRAMQELLAQYMDYIHHRQNEDELTLMEHYTGLSCEENYPANAAEWRRNMRTEPVWDASLLPVDIAICLDCPHLWEAFLSMDWKDFCKLYWEENALTNHPITQMPVTHLYLGNSFCNHLIPPISLLPTILQKAEALGLIPVLVTAPMAENMISSITEYLCTAAAYRYESSLHPELVLGDLGILGLIRALEEQGKLPVDFFQLRLGMLPVKRKKDFRISFRKDFARETAAYYRTSANSNCFREEMMKKGITSYSWEACGYPIAINGPTDSLHLPLYQMNTAGHCTLYAQAVYGDRGHQQALSNCTKPCEHCTVLYPEGLPMFGMWNTIFGYSSYEINHVEVLNDYIRAGIHRLVLRG